MAEKKLIMAWSECTISIGEMGESESMGTSLKSVGIIKDKSSTLEPEPGEAMKAVASGNKTVAREESEGSFKAKTRVIEPSDELYTTLGLGSASSEDFNVKTHTVGKNFSLQIDPKNVGARGIKAPKTAITCKPGWSEEEGNFLDLEFDILFGEAGYWYTRYTKKA